MDNGDYSPIRRAKRLGDAPLIDRLPKDARELLAVLHTQRKIAEVSDEDGTIWATVDYTNLRTHTPTRQSRALKCLMQHGVVKFATDNAVIFNAGIKI